LRFVVDRGLDRGGSASEETDHGKPCTMDVGLATLLAVEESILLQREAFGSRRPPEQVAIEAGANALRRLQSAGQSMAESG
jgi:hypothetical protein